MGGRLEHQMKVEQDITRITQGKSQILKDYVLSIQDKTFNTRLQYTHHVKDFLVFLNNMGIDINDDVSLKNVKPSHINRFIDSVRTKEDGGMISESYWNSVVCSIKSFFQFLCNDGIISGDDDPSSGIRVPRSKTDKPVVYMVPKEVGVLKNNIENGVGSNLARKRQEKWRNRDLAIINLALSTGLRLSALTEINISDIDFDNLKISVIEKENFKRDVYINNDVAKVLKLWIRDRASLIDNRETDALFISNERTRISQRSVQTLVKKYSSGIDKHITPHKMRSTFAVNGYEATNDIYVVAEALGHSRVETTKRYVRVSEDRKRSLIDSVSEMYKGV